MKLGLFCSLLLLTTVTFAQEKIVRDTINLRGYIYQSDGKPAKYMLIRSSYSQVDYSNYNFKLGTTTDTNGYFELRGARPYDTLTLAAHELYNTAPYYNKGSRYMVIYLPPPKTVDLTASNRIIISKKRLHPKPKALFKPEPFNGCILFSEVYILPSPIDKAHRALNLTDYTDSVKAHINYPPAAVANNIEGTVTVGFTVERDGSLADFKILRGIGYGCDEAVINSIKHTLHWRPAINNGRALAMVQTISVEFKLTDK